MDKTPLGFYSPRHVHLNIQTHGKNPLQEDARTHNICRTDCLLPLLTRISCSPVTNHYSSASQTYTCSHTTCQRKHPPSSPYRQPMKNHLHHQPNPNAQAQAEPSFSSPPTVAPPPHNTPPRKEQKMLTRPRKDQQAHGNIDPRLRRTSSHRRSI